jgi:hypothetical protein
MWLAVPSQPSRSPLCGEYTIRHGKFLSCILPADRGEDNFQSARRLSMQSYALTAIWCLFMITAVVVYIPLMYMRKTDKILKTLQQIEANTRKS